MTARRDLPIRSLTLAEYHQLQADQMREADLQSLVIRNARGYGWTLIYHTRTSVGSAPGYPDLHLLHPAGISMFVELKSQKGKLTQPQNDWLAALRAAGCNAHVIRPIHAFDGTLTHLLTPANAGAWPGEPS